jgi:hypothetical protein
MNWMSTRLSGDSYSAHCELKYHLIVPGEEGLVPLRPRWPTHTGSLGQQDSDNVTHKDFCPFTLAHQAEELSITDFVGTQDSNLYQQFDTTPSKTPTDDAGDSSKDFAALSSPHLGNGGMSTEGLAEPASLSEYITKLVDQGREGFIFEEDNLSPSTWERLKQLHQQNELYLKAEQLRLQNELYLIAKQQEQNDAYLKVSQLMENYVCSTITFRSNM